MEDASSGWVAAIAIGGFAGWLAEKYMLSDVGMLMNITLGIIGAAIASGTLTWFGVTWAGWLGYLVGGFVGACILILVIRLLKRT